MDERILTLKNGIEMYCAQAPLHAAAFGVLIPRGAADEISAFSGMTHLCEHLCFKRTDTLDQRQIYERMETLGVDIQAMTSKRDVIFTFKARPEVFSDALNLLFDMLVFDGYTDEDISSELSIVLSEIRERNYGRAFEEDVFDMLWKKERWRNPVLGTQDTISAFSREEILDFKRGLMNSGLKLALCGQVSEADVRLVDSLFGLLPRAETPAEEELADAEPSLRAERFGTGDRDVNLFFSYVCHTDSADDFHALDWLRSALADGAGAAVMAELREKYGLVYSMDSILSRIDDQMILDFSFLVDRRDVRQAAELFFEVVERIRAEGVGRQLPVLRAFFDENLVFLEDDPRELVMVAFDEFAVSGELVRLSDQRKRLKDLDEARLRAAAKRFLGRENCYLHCYGRVKRGDFRYLERIYLD